MTNKDAIKWLENLKNDIGNPYYERLWPYAQAIDEICELFEKEETIAPIIEQDMNEYTSDIEKNIFAVLVGMQFINQKSIVRIAEGR